MTGACSSPKAKAQGRQPCWLMKTIAKNDGKTIGKPWENRDLYGKSHCFMGKSIISTGPCSIAMKQITNGYLVWVKQCHFYHPWLGMVTIPPIEMVMTGGWFVALVLNGSTILRCIDHETYGDITDKSWLIDEYRGPYHLMSCGWSQSKKWKIRPRNLYNRGHRGSEFPPGSKTWWRLTGGYLPNSS